MLDYEVEVGFIIGKYCKDVKPENAFDVIMGYTVYNDITAREVQRSAALGGVFLGKNFDTTNPIGPYIVTADEVPNPESLRVHCRGERRDAPGRASDRHDLQDTRTHRLLQPDVAGAGRHHLIGDILRRGRWSRKTPSPFPPEAGRRGGM